MSRSYVRYLAALLVALALALPAVAGVVHAAQVSVGGGKGVVFTSEVSVGGQVEFFFNLTGQTWVGPTGYIYLSSNGNNYITMGDTPITRPFTTVNSTVQVQYIIGNITITAQDVKNFISNLSYAAQYYSSQNPNASTVLNELLTRHWALVYLKFATSTPSPTYTGPAVAAGPFNLTLAPAFGVSPAYSNYMGYYNCTVSANKYGIYAVQQQSVSLTGLPQSILSYISTGSVNFTIYARYVNLQTGLSSPYELVYSFSNVDKVLTYNSYVFVSPPPAPTVSNDELTIPGAVLNPGFPLPVLTQVPGTNLNGFNMTMWTLSGNAGTIIVPKPYIANGRTVVFNGGPAPYNYSAGYVVSTSLTFSVSNMNATGLITSKPPSFDGWLDLLPSFEFASMAAGVAGPATQLNPGDIVNVSFANMPENSVITSLTAVGNESLLPTEPIAVFEWNDGYWSALEGFYLAGNMTNATGPISGETAHSIAFVVPNAPYGLPFSYLGFYLDISYTAQLANGSTPGFTSAVYGSASPACESAYAVHPFIQVFSSNASGVFSYNSTLLLGNYILVRGFGFPAGGYSNLTFTYGTSSTTASPMPGTLQTDQYGDFVYITQVPYAGSFATALASSGPGAYPITISGEAGAGLAGAYSVIVPAGVGDALVYVEPTPTTWDNTAYALSATQTPASIPLTGFAVPTTNGELYLPNIYGVINMPANLIRFPYEATQYIVNGTTTLIPSWEGVIPNVVIAGGPVSGTLWANFTMAGFPSYFDAVNVTSYFITYGTGYADIANLTVPDLPGTVSYYPGKPFAYTIELSANGKNSEASYTGVFVATAAEIVMEPAGFDLVTLIVNYTSSANPLGLPTLITTITKPPSKATSFVYAWPPYAYEEVPYLLLLPGTELEVYIFGSPVSYNTTFTLPTAHPHALPVYINISAACGAAAEKIVVGYIVNGTLWSPSFPGYYSPAYKGGVFNPMESLCSSGTYTLKLQVVGPWVPTTGTAYVPQEPMEAAINYIAPSQVPAEPVVVSVVGSGSTINAGEPFMILVPAQVSVLGLPPSVAQYFFKVSGLSVQAYVLNGTSPILNVTAFVEPTSIVISGYRVYTVTLPPNVTEGQLVVAVSESATYIFGGQTYTGAAVAEMGVLPPVTSSSINETASSIESLITNVGGEVGSIGAAVNQIQGTVNSIYTAVTAMYTTLQKLNSTLTTIGPSLSSANATLSSIASEVSTVYSDVTSMSSILKSMNSTLSGVSSSVSSAGTTASAAYNEASVAVGEAHTAAANAATAATYALGALIVSIIALALVAYVAFVKL